MNTKKKIITAIIGVEAVIIAAVIVFLFYMNSDTVKINHQLELAQRYLLEEDYEQAIAVFEGIIEIDPKNEEAYLGMAEAYAAVDDLENVVQILEKASQRIDSEEVLAMLETHTAEIEQRQQAAQRAAEAAAQAAADDAASASEQTATETSPQDTNAAKTQTSEVEMVLTGFIVQDGELYYYDETGNYVTGWFDKNDNRYCARDDGRLYKDGEHEIDSTKYLFDQGGICLGEVEEEKWKQAYIDLVNQYEAGNFDGASEVSAKCEYDLIPFDNGAIPALVIGITDDVWGNKIWLYSYVNDKICELGELSGGMHGPFYQYIEGKGIVVGTSPDFAGEIQYYDLYQKKNNQLVSLYEENLREQDFMDTNGNGFPDEEDEYGSYFYYGDTPITEEEFHSYMPQGKYVDMQSRLNADAIIREINFR